MERNPLQAIQTLILCALCGSLIDSSQSQIAFAYTPKSPEVQRLLKDSLGFLSKSTKESTDHRLGGKCLIGLALLKAELPSNHPKIVEAVAACKDAVAENATPKDGLEAIYSVGIAAIFLIELDADLYQREIKTLLSFLREKQKNHGGWGYPARETGDTSMTQYGVLSAWTARQAGFNVPNRSIERVAGWLMRTQDPSGAWGYQGIDPGSYTAVKQDYKVGPSMAAAGAGSLLMSAHLLGAIRIKEEATLEGVPAPLRLVKSKQQNGPGDGEAGNGQAGNGEAKVQIDTARLRQSIGRANSWFQANYTLEGVGYTHYYLYALERYMSFRELAEGRSPKEAFWYNDGVEYLTETQNSDGSWKGRLPKPIDTAFSILFLLRSTRKSIRHAQGYGDELGGGRGLPDDATNLKTKGGRVVRDPFTRQADEMLKILSDSDHPDFEKLLQSSQAIPLFTEGPVDEKQAEKLRQLIAGGEPPVRRLAVRALARTGDLNHVPILIYGLTDPDWSVVREARDGLRFISRKFEGFGIPDKQNNERRIIAIKRWKQWYLTLRPEALFEE